MSEAVALLLAKQDLKPVQTSIFSFYLQDDPDLCLDSKPSKLRRLRQPGERPTGGVRAEVSQGCASQLSGFFKELRGQLQDVC